MKKRTLLYVPALIIFAFAMFVLIVHSSWMMRRYFFAVNDAQMVFFYSGRVTSLRPEGENTGLKVNDVITAMNGQPFNDDRILHEALLSGRETGNVNVTVRRKINDEQTETRELTLPVIKIERDFSYYSRLVVGFIYTYFVPAFCVLIGFWVLFVRIYDPLAWVLLFIMLGFSCIGLEGYTGGSIVGVYTQIFFSSWALSMFLFGIYFPERLTLDARFPWLKWIFIVPFGLQMIFTFLNLIGNFTGSGMDFLKPVNNFFGKIALPLNIFGMSTFFAMLGWKSGTLQNADARRRLKLMVYGTSVAMLPSLSIIIYGFISGKGGSFYDRAPWWFAILALLLMLVFPLTMAYVIIVHRAMDVRVVVRQGLQYALARNGVKVVQGIILAAVIVGVIWIFRSNNEFSAVEQFGFIAAGLLLILLVDFIAKRLKVWIDRKFFREAYNAEQILSDLSDEVRTMVETKPLLETVSTKISESLHVPQIILLLKNGHLFQAAHSLGYENLPSATLTEDDRTIEKLKKNETLVIYQDDEDSWIHEEVRDDERLKLQQLNSQLLLPIGAKNELSGVISLSPKRSEEPYSPNDLRLLKSVAVQTGLALENSRLTEAIASEAAQKERLNRELEIAREVQERLFPQELPAIEGLDYFGACRPALGVGGDYYDFLELPDNKFGIAIGDVSGKGIGASLMMASLQASLRGQAIHCGSDLAALMKHVNTLLYEASTSNRYATFFYAQFDAKTRKMIYVNAGHNPPMLLRKSGEELEVIRLEEGGAVVGMLPSVFVNYSQGELEMQSGDLLVGFTDGISEAMNPQEEEWGEDKMLERLKEIYGQTAAETLSDIVAKADKFANGAKQHDDMTMIIVNVS